MTTYTDKAIKLALNTSILPDLPSSLLSSLPPLPPISDPELLRVATTHSSLYQKARDRYDLTLAEEILDYEKLEHVGDAILGSVVTVLLHDMYPNLREGAATLLKHHLVSNRTLAQIAAAYHLPKKLIAAQAALYATREQTKTKGSMLEAWIAAVYYSYLKEDSSNALVNGSAHSEKPSDGSQGKILDASIKVVDETTGDESEDTQAATVVEVQEKISELKINAQANGEVHPQQESGEATQVNETAENSSEATSHAATHTPAASPTATESTSKPASESTVENKTTSSNGADLPTGAHATQAARNTGDAYLYIDQWLRALFIPIAKYAIEEMRQEQSRLSNTDTASVLPDDKALGAAALLQSHCSRYRWEDPNVSFDRTMRDLWKCTLTVTDGDGKIWMAEATRHNKKAGQNAAAFILCQEMGLFKDE